MSCCENKTFLILFKHPQCRKDICMPFIKWSDDLSVKVAKFDEQHKRLIEHTNALFEAMSRGQGKQHMESTLSSLYVYTRTHFEDEEQEMHKHAYPGLTDHAAEHRSFIEKLDGFIQKMNKGELYLSVEVLDFLQDWLQTHIRYTDKNYSQFLSERGVN